jgi:hypothetical protein
MNDIRADRDMNRRRRSRLVRRGEDTRPAELKTRVQDFAADGLAQPDPLPGGSLRGLVEKCTGFLGHPESAVRQSGANIFGRASRERQFEVVDDTGAVGRDRVQNSVAN